MNRNTNDAINNISINKFNDIESQKKLGSLIKLFNATNKCEPRNTIMDDMFNNTNMILKFFLTSHPSYFL